jgi:hypothetical protein
MFRKDNSLRASQKRVWKNTFVSLWERTPGEFIQDKGGGAEELLKRKRIDDLEVSRRNPKSRGPSDRGGVAWEITREHRCGELKWHRRIGVRGLVMQGNC